MTRKARWIAGTTATAALIGTGAGIAVAGNGDDHEPAITGTALDRASKAALDHTGGGRVTDTEVGDEEGYYEVEVTLPDGRQVDVHLDQAFTVLGTETDGPGDETGSDEGEK